MSRKKIVVRLELHGPLKDRFEYLMQHYQTASYTELVRLLINMRYEQLQKDKHISWRSWLVKVVPQTIDLKAAP